MGKSGAIGNSLRNMSRTWELFAFDSPTPKKKKEKNLTWKVHSPHKS